MSRGRSQTRIKDMGLITDKGLAWSILMNLLEIWSSAYKVYTDGYVYDANGICRGRVNRFDKRLPDKVIRNVTNVGNDIRIHSFLRGLLKRGKKHVIVYNHKLHYFTLKHRGGTQGGPRGEEWMVTDYHVEDAKDTKRIMVYGQNKRHQANYAVEDYEEIHFIGGRVSAWGEIHCIPKRRN